MKGFIYPALAQEGCGTMIMVHPFYFPRLAGEEEAYQRWTTIYDVPPAPGGVIDKHIVVTTKIVDGSIEVITDAEPEFHSPHECYYNAFVCYNASSGSLLWFRPMGSYDETFKTENGKLKIIFDLPMVRIYQ